MDRIVLASVLAPLLVACGEPIEPAETPTQPDPNEIFAERQQLGSFAVGYRQVDVIYRPDASDADRTIPVEIWYPAVAGAPAAEYAVGGIIELNAPSATTGDPVATETPFPLAVYSHGNGGVGLVGYPIGEYLASYGWVVVAPDHTGNTALDFFLGTAEPFLSSVINRPQDVSATIDWVEGLADDPLAGQVDTSSVLVVGHSFGGYTAFAVGGAKPNLDNINVCDDPSNAEDPNCVLANDPDVQALFDEGFTDSRVTALVPQAPAIGFYDAAEISGVTLPTMLQSGGLDATTTAEESALPAWAALDGTDDVWVDMPTGGHVTFLSICTDLTEDLIETFQPGAGEDGCGPMFIDTTVALPVLNAYIGMFGETHVLGNDLQTTFEAATAPEGFVLTTN